VLTVVQAMVYDRLANIPPISASHITQNSRKLAVNLFNQVI
jgi:hypothetical protein